MKMFKIAKTFLSSKIKDKVPFDVTQFITARCNLKCKYCCYPQKIKELSTEQIKTAMNEFSNLGTLYWTFTGGEPTMREDIGQLINYVKDVGIVYVQLLTNGVYWYKKRINDLKNLDSVVFSLDGPKDINDKIRGISSFDSVMESIKLTMERNIDFTLTTTMTKANLSNNFHGLKFMFEIAKKFNCKINFQPVIRLELQNYPLSNFQPTVEQTLKGIKLVKKFKKEYKLVKFSDFTYEIWLKFLKNEQVKFNCLAGKNFCYIDPDGVILPLPFRHDEGVSGLKFGFGNAFRRINHNHNELCYQLCFPEKSNLYNLNFSTVKNYLSVIFK